MTNTPPRATSRPIGRFVDDSFRSAGMLALVVLVTEVLVDARFTASPRRLLAIVLGIGVARTVLVWVLKAKLRDRWPAIDSLS